MRRNKNNSIESSLSLSLVELFPFPPGNSTSEQLPVQPTGQTNQPTTCLVVSFNFFAPGGLARVGEF